VAFDPQSGRIDFHRAFASGTRCSCPQCGVEYPPVHDTLVTSAGLDETASRRGHNDISLFHDLDAQRVLYACEGRKARVVAQFADALEAHGACAGNSCAVCVGMSASYQAGVCEHLPWAAITFDEFHVIQLVNRAVDAVRRQEVKRAPERRRTRYIWLQDKHA